MDNRPTNYQYRHISELKEWDKNPRNITARDFARLKDQITLLGQYKPLITTTDGTVLGGNMRLKALRELGAEKVATLTIDFIGQPDGLWYAMIDGMQQKKPFTSKLQGMTEYALSDNDRAGFYDNDMLANLLGEVDIDLDAYAIDLSQPVTINDVLNPDGGVAAKEDEPPAVDNDNPAISQLGKVYQLGNHRLMCGDATSLEDVQKLLNGQSADMIFIDPPYNIDYEGKTKEKLTIENDKMSSTDFYNFLLQAFGNLNVISKAGAVIYICHADMERVNFQRAMQDAGWSQRQNIIWVKQHFVMGRQDYQWMHEPILYGWKEGEAHYFTSDRTKTTVWPIDRPTVSLEHPTMKPIALMITALQNSSKGEDVIVDTFAGSGSTLIACEQAHRICYAMELDPRYADVIRKRYATFIGEGDTWQESTPEVPDNAPIVS